MNNRHTQWIVALMFTCAGILPGCTLEEPASTDDSPALNLFAVQNLSVTNLTWDKVNVTGFKEYIILQSASDIPNSPTPTVNADVVVLKRIKDVNTTSFSASSLPFSSSVCYKLYCAVDDRFLYSATNCINQEFTVLPGFYDRADHEPGFDEMALFDRTNDLMVVYNYKTNAITNSIDEFSLNFPTLEISKWNTTNYLFAFDQSPALIIRYNYPTLGAVQSKNLIQFPWSVKSFNRFLFLTTEEFGKGFQVLDRSNFNVLASRTGMSGNQNIAVFEGDPMTVLTLGRLESKKYLVDMNGHVVEESLIPGRVTQPDQQSICDQGSELFIGGHQGSIVNRNGENVGTLTSNLNFFILINRLSEDEQTAVSVVNENGIMRLDIADISHLPAVIKTNSYDIPALQYGEMILEDGIIYLIGATFSNQAETFILKYPM